MYATREKEDELPALLVTVFRELVAYEGASDTFTLLNTRVQSHLPTKSTDRDVNSELFEHPDPAVDPSFTLSTDH